MIIKDVPAKNLIGTQVRSLIDYNKIGVVEKLEIVRGMVWAWVRWSDEQNGEAMTSGFFHHEGKNEVVL